ncbi:hypothetical protein ILUMI_10725 [Ignelater luminosus]|uniref:Uncharacterized protein n=1 Tax=Ignelater luminosus TaxID=2038154 RepID=A0A8K0GEN3_IGNLU|nr:hypothetical protein ILUMI_10725 [Ignelater luminosus]
MQCRHICRSFYTHIRLIILQVRMGKYEYAIVRFIAEDDAPGIVTINWICEDDKCRYPNVRTNEARDKLLKSNAKPTEEWITCPIKMLSKYETFADTRLHLSKAEETSHLESEAEEDCRRKWKRKTSW